MADPYAPPEAPALERHYGGIRRLSFIGIIIGVYLAFFLLSLGSGLALAGVFFTGDEGLLHYGALFLLLLVLLFVLTVILVYQRFKNIGRNPWWCLLMLVPVLNLLVVVPCLVLQEGYADTKKLDTGGKVIACIILGFVILYLIWRTVTGMAS